MSAPQDIISRIDTFIAECHAASCDDGESVASLLASCRDAIAQLRCEQRWIPVGERLPDEGVEVLGYSPLIGVYTVLRCRGPWSGWRHRWMLSDAPWIVTAPPPKHWMPLPLPAPPEATP